MTESNTKILKIKCQKLHRKLLLISIIILALISFKPITNKIYSVVYDSFDSQSAYLSEMINSVIGMPYRQKPYFKNDSPDVKRLSKEEWLALPHYPFRTDEASSKVDMVRDELRLVEKMPDWREATHAESIRLRNLWPILKPQIAVYDKFCPHFLTCELMNVVVQRFALDNLEILKSIIKIAERPCDYMREPKDVKPGEDIVFTHDFGWNGHVFETEKYTEEDIKLFYEDRKKRLHCNNKSFFDFIPTISSPSIFYKKYILIIINEDSIYANKNEPRVEILVERKDI